MMQRVEFRLVRPEETALIREVAALDRLSVGADAWSEDTLSEECGRDGGFVLACLTENAELCGFAVFSTVLDEGCLNSIAVGEGFRRQHIGEGLISEMTEILRSRGVKMISLEVRESNAAARGLYEKSGFTCRGVRKNFYRGPKENAAIYLMEI
ncbi:MAG: ribosomal protein S18-alanine N-acetyltransferase [Oscillospiraceae bacterium]|nr:ribosomal protein S18-alanine N-acetyltransferase [Oscillospiraceae bacterium]